VLEHWFVVHGEGNAITNGAVSILGPGDAIDIPLGAVHRMENSGDADLVFIEVQRGDYFGEDDIVRLEDDFDRTGPA
jgi:mannose-6-phosphate isomerase